MTTHHTHFYYQLVYTFSPTSLLLQTTLCEEVDAVLGVDGEPTYDNMSAASMPYMNGVVYETLRLHPPVPYDAKICLHEVRF